ncbi:hypothetical protein QBC35DRAFT_488484, partial [Podospora australis]
MPLFLQCLILNQTWALAFTNYLSYIASADLTDKFTCTVPWQSFPSFIICGSSQPQRVRSVRSSCTDRYQRYRPPTHGSGLSRFLAGPAGGQNETPSSSHTYTQALTLQRCTCTFGTPHRDVASFKHWLS